MATKDKWKEELSIFEINRFVLNDQQIMDSEFLSKGLSDKVKKLVDGRFVILDDDNVNAYAFIREGHRVVALTKGSLYQYIYLAQLFMLKEDFFPDIGNESLVCKKNTPSLTRLINVETGLPSFHVSNDNERRNAGYTIAALAVKFMVYHEIGHHFLGHLKDNELAFDLPVGENMERKQLGESNAAYRRMETEADFFAIQTLLKEFAEMELQWSPFFKVDLMHIEMASLLVVALVIVKESLGIEVFDERNVEKKRYLPKILRLIFALTTIVLSKDYNLEDSFREALIEVPETRKIIEESVGDVHIDDSDGLRKALTAYLCNIAVFSEQTYADTCFGKYGFTAFGDDLKAMKWWKTDSKNSK